MLHRLQLWNKVSIALALFVLIGLGALFNIHGRELVNEWVDATGRWWRAKSPECKAFWAVHVEAKEKDAQAKREGFSLNERMGLVVVAIEAHVAWQRCTRGQPVN